MGMQDKYELVRDLGAGNFGIARLMRDVTTGELVAVKLLPRGPQVNKNVVREIINHRLLCHPNIIGFREVCLSPSHLIIVMQYATNGVLFDRLHRAKRFSEDETRFFFQQVVNGMDYCHRMGVCHRDLKMENLLLHGASAPILKIADFGYSKHILAESAPKSAVGTPVYIAPEVLSRQQYAGPPADVWSAGVMLYTMLVGRYPFEDPCDPLNFKKIVRRIKAVDYAWPADVVASEGVRDLMGRIFVLDPGQRISVQGLRDHPWFNVNLPQEIKYDRWDPERHCYPESVQPLEQIQQVLELARIANGPCI